MMKSVINNFEIFDSISTDWKDEDELDSTSEYPSRYDMYPEIDPEQAIHLGKRQKKTKIQLQESTYLSIVRAYKCLVEDRPSAASFLHKYLSYMDQNPSTFCYAHAWTPAAARGKKLTDGEKKFQDDIRTVFKSTQGKTNVLAVLVVGIFRTPFVLFWFLFRTVYSCCFRSFFVYHVCTFFFDSLFSFMPFRALRVPAGHYIFTLKY
jgi:hypothetical protein